MGDMASWPMRFLFCRIIKIKAGEAAAEKGMIRLLKCLSQM